MHERVKGNKKSSSRAAKILTTCILVYIYRIYYISLIEYSSQCLLYHYLYRALFLLLPLLLLCTELRKQKPKFVASTKIWLRSVIYIVVQVVKIFAALQEDFLLPFTSSCILGVDYSQNASSGHYSLQLLYVLLLLNNMTIQLKL